jgi:Xaa-Pro aminopeptidase
MNYLLQRHTAISQAFKTHGTDGFLVTHPVNVTYLTGFTGDSSYCLVTPKGEILISDARFEEQIKEECPSLEVHIRPHSKTTLEAAVEVIFKSGFKSVGVEGNRLTLGELEQLKHLAPKVNFASLDGIVEAQRAVKDPGEVEKIREAVRVAERGFRMFMATLREADTEKDMVDALEGYVRRAGAKSTSFPPIIAVGDRGALPHAQPTLKTLGDGSKLLVDWGADLGYKSDLTRTLRSPFGTAPTRKNKQERVGFRFEDLYKAVLDAQNAALGALRSGVKAKEVDAAARKSFASTKLDKHPDIDLSKFFTHGLGHGIGLEIHEAPKIRANSEDVLQAGMVVTIEPGIYIPGWGGIRIEDDVLITHDGYRLLSTLSREATTITTL